MPEQPGDQAVSELVRQHTDPEQDSEHDRDQDGHAGAGSGTTWVMTGMPSAAMIATDSTQDGATTMRHAADPAQPESANRPGWPEAAGRGCRAGPAGDSPSKGSRHRVGAAWDPLRTVADWARLTVRARSTRLSVATCLMPLDAASVRRPRMPAGPRVACRGPAAPAVAASVPGQTNPDPRYPLIRAGRLPCRRHGPAISRPARCCTATGRSTDCRSRRARRPPGAPSCTACSSGCSASPPRSERRSSPRRRWAGSGNR